MNAERVSAEALACQRTCLPARSVSEKAGSVGRSAKVDMLRGFRRSCEDAPCGNTGRQGDPRMVLPEWINFCPIGSIDENLSLLSCGRSSGDMLFQNIRIILLLPNKEPETVAMAHQLRPRFLAGRNSDLAEGPAVLKKMFKEH